MFRCSIFQIIEPFSALSVLMCELVLELGNSGICIFLVLQAVLRDHELRAFRIRRERIDLSLRAILCT
jgi:hypothetical protein